MKFNRRALLTTASATALSLSLSACGFRLRGHFTAPFDTIYLQMRTNTRFSTYLTRLIESGSNVKVVSSPNHAQAILEILRLVRERDILTINDFGRARQYQLTLSLDFRVTSPSGYDYVEPTQLVAQRDMTYNDSEFLSRESEEDLLYQDMEQDLCAQLVRYLEAAKSPSQS